MKWATDEFTGRRFGKYEVLCRLAVGGMAEIFLGFAHQGEGFGVPVVLKRILDDYRESPEALQMFINEAKLTATLSHANIARVLDLDAQAEDVLLVIEFIPGANLTELAESLESRGELVPIGLALSVVSDVAKGLGHAHAHVDPAGHPTPIVHRDVTPQNVMVDFDGVGKVLDFGIARAMGSRRRTVAGMVRGTTTYMSPEQVLGKDLDPRSDLFSLGIILHELLVGERLFHRGSPEAEMAAVYEAEIRPPSMVNRRVPKQLDGVVMRALDRIRDRRYQTSNEFLQDIALSAGTMAWPRAKCADLLREHFADRRRALLVLVDSIGVGETTRETEIGLVAPRDNAPVFPEDLDDVTLPATLPTLPGAAPPLPSQRAADRSPDGPEDETTTHEHGTAPEASAPGSPGAGAVTTLPVAPPSGEVEHLSAPTRVSEQQLAPTVAPATSHDGQRLPGTPMDSRPLPPELPGRVAFPGDDAGSAQREVSSVWLVVAASLAILFGVVSGASLHKLRQGNQTPQATQGRVSLITDRVVDVLLEGKMLGKTPLSDLPVPAGSHVFVLIERDGTRRGLDPMPVT